MKVTIFLLLLIGFSIVSSAQTDVFRLSIKEYNAEDMYNIPRNAVYTDLLAFYNFEYLAPLDYLLGLTTKLGVLNRITSYNVCYTKLLRSLPLITSSRTT